MEDEFLIEACTDRLRKWLLATPSVPSQTRREALQKAFRSLSYLFSESGLHSEIGDGSGVFFWAQMRHKYMSSLCSKTLQEVFLYVERAPLLCMLDDFLVPLNSFLVKYETLAHGHEDEQLKDSKTSDSATPDSLFLEGLEFYCILRSRLGKLETKWRATVDAMIPPDSSSSSCNKGFVEAHKDVIISALSSLVDLVRSEIHKCYDVKPRYLQLCENLKLSDKEQDAMHFIFMQNAGIHFFKSMAIFDEKVIMGVGGSHGNSMAKAAASFANMSGFEMYEFFSENRAHIQQELFGPEDEFSTLLSSGFLLMSPTIIRACCGCTLTAEELYKIDKTVLADIMAGERKEDIEGKKPTVEGISELPSETVIATKDEDDDSIELEEILRACDELQGQSEEGASKERGDSETESLPYKTDLEYLEDNFELIETLVKARKTETNDDAMLLRPDQRRPEAVMREMKAKARSLTAKINGRMSATKSAGAWLPRLERLAGLRKLDTFEKNILLTLTGCMVSRNLRNSRDHRDSVFSHNTNISMLIGLFCDGLGEQIKARVYFYRTSRLVKEGLIQVSDPPLLSRGNFLDCGVELDRRLLDYIVGLDTEINELVDGSDLYTPDITFADVALPSDQKQLLINTFDSFEKFQATCKELKLSTHGYNKGLCLLFYGPSGTGKTMTANAVAHYLEKKLLLVTVSLLTEAQLTKDLLRFLFREAKIHNAVIFFDECEPLFETRDNRTNTSLALLLTEIEQYDGIIFLATNRHQDLDEAMHRRIQLALPFSVPDYILRIDIWKTHVPAQLVEQEIDWNSLAQNYELTGGLIRNAVLSAISLATKKTDDDSCSTVSNSKIVLSSEDLHRGAKLQLRGLLEMVDFERRIIPTYGLEELVLEPSTKSLIEAIINSGKTHKFISTQWGFNGVSGGKNVATAAGIVCLFSGAAGVGKSSVAYSIAYELGQPIKEANCTELLSHTVSSNPRTGRGIATFFKDAFRANAIVVLDGAEFVLGSMSSSLLSGIVGCESYTLAYQIEHYPGMVILTSRQEIGLLNLARLPKLKYVLALRVPSVSLREKMWRKLIPKKLPLSPSIDLEQLAERFVFSGGDIASVICAAAELVASGNGGRDKVTTDLLEEVAENHMTLNQSRQLEHLSIFQ